MLRLGLFLLAGILSGCAATESKLPVPYALDFEADHGINPDSNGRPSPVQITVYELKSPAAFQATDYFALQADPSKALGADLLEVQRLTLQPGTPETLRRPGHVGAKALGIVAGYRDLDASQWRMLIDLPDSRSTNIYKFWQFSPGAARIKIQLDSHGMTLVSQEN
jgi:type VI secretion system protein VasD